MNRCPDDCSYRRRIEAGNGCELLREIVQLDDLSFCRVGDDACTACCQSFPSSTRDLNPVVAGLLFQLADRILAGEIGAQHGCTVDRARVLSVWAEESLPAIHPGEDDGVVVAAPSIDVVVDRPVSQLIPPPDSRHGPCVKSWSVGVTTAPRGLSTIDACLESLIRAGWNCPRIFSDSRVELDNSHANLPITLREPTVGAWPNYYLSLAELLMREPDADAYLIVQDDALFFAHPELRTYLEDILWPSEPPGLVSLFCAREYTQTTSGWHRLDETWIWGAVAFVFSREAAQLFLADHDVVMHRWNKHYDGLRGIDVLIGKWADRRGIPIFFPTPSLVQHIGHVSAIWKTARATGPRRADRFVGDE